MCGYWLLPQKRNNRRWLGRERPRCTLAILTSNGTCTSDGCHSPSRPGRPGSDVRPRFLPFAATCRPNDRDEKVCLVTYRALNNKDHARSTFQLDTSNTYSSNARRIDPQILFPGVKEISKNETRKSRDHTGVFLTSGGSCTYG